MRRWLLAALLGGGVSLAAYRRGALTLDGALGATVVGGIVFARGGVAAAGSLLVFFGSSTALSRLGKTCKEGAPRAQAKGARRDLWQVLANGGVATLCIGLRGRRQGGGELVGALAAAAADTWATELGLLSTRPPRLITTLSPVAAGTSGGVTPEGLAASVGGALVVGLTWAMLGGGGRGVPVALVAGLAGSLMDSLLGATVQAVFRCPSCWVLTESAVHQPCAQHTELVHGQRWITNETVNALSTLTGAAIGGTLWRSGQTTERGGARQGRG